MTPGVSEYLDPPIQSYLLRCSSKLKALLDQDIFQGDSAPLDAASILGSAHANHQSVDG